jgi:hypothetical protein
MEFDTSTVISSGKLLKLPQMIQRFPWKFVPTPNSQIPMKNYPVTVHKMQKCHMKYYERIILNYICDYNLHFMLQSTNSHAILLWQKF